MSGRPIKRTLRGTDRNIALGAHDRGFLASEVSTVDGGRCDGAW